MTAAALDQRAMIAQRKRLEAKIEELISLLDLVDGDPDIEEENEHGGDVQDAPHDEDVDCEPELGWTEHVDQERARMTHFAWWATDGEPDLGWTGNGTGFVETREKCTC